MPYMIFQHPVYRKAQASILAVPERQSLETLTRDSKTSARALAQLKDKVEQLTARKTKLTEDENIQKQRRKEVFYFVPSYLP